MPALIYLVYATTRIIIDAYKGLYNLAFVQVWVTILFVYLLNVMCRAGFGIISWIVVSIPFLLMSVIAAVLLFVFGLNPATGKAVYAPQAQPPNSTTGQTSTTADNQTATAITTATGQTAATQSPTTTQSATTATTQPAPASTMSTSSQPTRIRENPMVNGALPVSVRLESFNGILGTATRPNPFGL